MRLCLSLVPVAPRLIMRPLLEARLVNDAFGDPGLFVDFLDERRALLFDLGDIARLMPRELMRLSHVFVTHAHMDHFSGFDKLLRVLLGRKPRIVLVGGPGFLAQVEHKLLAYTWNVVHRYATELVIEVAELGLDRQMRRACFSSRHGFARKPKRAPRGPAISCTTKRRSGCAPALLTTGLHAWPTWWRKRPGSASTRNAWPHPA